MHDYPDTSASPLEAHHQIYQPMLRPPVYSLVTWNYISSILTDWCVGVFYPIYYLISVCLLFAVAESICLIELLNARFMYHMHRKITCRYISINVPCFLWLFDEWFLSDCIFFAGLILRHFLRLIRQVICAIYLMACFCSIYFPYNYLSVCAKLKFTPAFNKSETAKINISPMH